MRPVSDAFLLNMAEVAAGLTGLFLVGVFFYVETGFRRSERARTVMEPYFRASTRIVLVLFSIPILLSLTLVVMEPVWSRILFAVLSVLLVAANLATAGGVGAVTKVTGSNLLLVNEVIGTVGVVAAIVLPWALGGFHPSREDLTWSILLAFASGFLSICATVLTAFDIARFESRTDDR